MYITKEIPFSRNTSDFFLVFVYIYHNWTCARVWVSILAALLYLLCPALKKVNERDARVKVRLREGERMRVLMHEGADA